MFYILWFTNILLFEFFAEIKLNNNNNNKNKVELVPRGIWRTTKKDERWYILVQTKQTETKISSEEGLFGLERRKRWSENITGKRIFVDSRNV